MFCKRFQEAFRFYFKTRKPGVKIDWENIISTETLAFNNRIRIECYIHRSDLNAVSDSNTKREIIKKRSKSLDAYRNDYNPYFSYDSWDFVLFRLLF